MNSQSSSNLILLSQGSSNNAVSHAMECDPPQSLQQQQQSSSASSTSSAAATAAANIARYGHPHRSRYGVGGGTSGGGGGSVGGGMLGGSQNPGLLGGAGGITHSKSTSLISSYAPASLPIDLGHSASNANLLLTGAGSGLSSIDHHPYQTHHINSSASAGNSNFGPFSSLSDAAGMMPISMPHSGAKSGQRGGPNAGTTNTTNNDPDESPMVGVCMQQSPVVIH